MKKTKQQRRLQRKAGKKRISTPRRSSYYVSEELTDAIENGELTHRDLDQFVQKHHALRRGQPQRTDFKSPGIDEYLVVTTDPTGRTEIMMNYEWDERSSAPSSRRSH